MSQRSATPAFSVQPWNAALTEVDHRMGPAFARSEARQRASAYLRALLSPTERKNGWQLAETIGDTTPYGVQHLLGRADWDADRLRDDLVAYVRDYLASEQAIVVLDETGFLKKGTRSAGVARQYSGTAGRIENQQVGVFVSYVSPSGHTLLDRDLYLPREWIDDPVRCQQAGIPATRRFATKPALARQMLTRLFATDLPVQWITGDSVYGDNRRLRVWLEEHERAYVLAVSGKDYVWDGWRQRRVSTILAQRPPDGWERLSAGAGAKGPRWYDWRRLPIGTALQEPGRRWLLIRRSVSDPSKVTAYVVYAPRDTPLPELVRVAGSRWAVEVDFQTAKGELGLDHYEVRSWAGWYRHVTLVLWAQALLTVLRTHGHAAEHVQKGGRSEVARSSLAAFKAGRGL